MRVSLPVDGVDSERLAEVLCLPRRDAVVRRLWAEVQAPALVPASTADITRRLSLTPQPKVEYSRD